jgi:hypothetical protein
LELELFAGLNHKVPFLKVQHYPLNASYFSIENRESYPVVDYISQWICCQHLRINDCRHPWRH